MHEPPSASQSCAYSWCRIRVSLKEVPWIFISPWSSAHLLCVLVFSGVVASPSVSCPLSKTVTSTNLSLKLAQGVYTSLNARSFKHSLLWNLSTIVLGRTSHTFTSSVSHPTLGVDLPHLSSFVFGLRLGKLGLSLTSTNTDTLPSALRSGLSSLQPHLNTWTNTTVKFPQMFQGSCLRKYSSHEMAF